MSRAVRFLVPLAVVSTLVGSSVALGLPWDIDMADSQTVKAFEQHMQGLPEGVVSQDNVLSPKAFRPNALRGTEASQQLLAPVATPERLELGKEMYDTYCYPCHGSDGASVGPVGQTARAPDRFPGILPLAGGAGVAKLRDDHWIYLTIRNGGANMPPYGHTMSDEEMWSIVHYIRTFEDAAYLSGDDADGEEQNP